MDLLVVAAAREELGDLPGEVLGVGPIVAGVRAAGLLAHRRPAGVLLIGTTGAYPGGPRVGEVVAGLRVGWSDGIAVLGLGYVPRAPEPIDGDPDLLARLGITRVSVLTTSAVTTDPALARQLGATWAVEHLEAFAVAFACREAGVPFAAVLGVANEVGPDAHAQWSAHRGAAEQAARRAAATVLRTDSVPGTR